MVSRHSSKIFQPFYEVQRPKKGKFWSFWGPQRLFWRLEFIFYLSGDVLAAYSRQKVDWNQLKCLTAFRIIFSSLIISLNVIKGPIFACLISAKSWYRFVEMVYRLSNKIFQPFWKSQRTLRTHCTSRKYIFLNSRKFDSKI